MIAIPLSQKDSTILHKEFSTAPYFALMNELSGSFRTVENKDNLLDMLKSNNIKSAVAYTQEEILETIIKSDIEVFNAFKNALTLEEIYTQALNSKFTKMY